MMSKLLFGVLCIALVGCGGGGEGRDCTSSEYFGQEGAFVKRRFMVLS
jgi:hypothetical protein